MRFLLLLGVTFLKHTVANYQRCVECLVHQYQKPYQLYIYDDNMLPALTNFSYYLVSMDSETKLDIPEVNFILITTFNLTRLQQKLESVTTNYSISPDAWVIVAYNGSKTEMSELFRIFWKYHLSNVIFLSKSLNLYTYYTISRNGCVASAPVDIGKCDCSKQFTKESLALQFRECDIRVCGKANPPYCFDNNHDKDDGIVATFIKLLGETLDFKVVPASKDCHVFYGAYSANNGDFKNNDFAYLMLQDEVAIFVPIAKPKSKWKNLLYIFDYSTWLGLLVSFVCIAATWYMLKTNTRLDTAFLYMFCVLLSSVHKKPTTYRSFFIIWCSCSFILVQSYQTFFASFMFKPAFSRQIKSLSDIMEDNLVTGGVPHQKFLFEELGMKGSQYSYYSKKFENCSFDPLPCYKRLMTGKFAYCTLTKKISYLLMLHKTDNCQMLPPIRVQHMVMLMPKGTPYLRRFQEILYRMFESGFQQHLDRHKWTFGHTIYKHKFAPMKLEHSVLFFVVHLVGCFLALLIYLLEYCYYCYKT